MSSIFEPAPITSIPVGGPPAGVSESPRDPDFGWRGVPVSEPKNAEAGIRARAGAFKTVEEFAAWRRSKGMPELTMCDLLWAFARFKGEPVGETATLKPVAEHR